MPAESQPRVSSLGPSDVCTAAKVRRLSRRVSQIYDEALAAHGLTIGQYGLLACLSRRRGTAIGALAGMLAADASTVSRLVRPLASAGLISIRGSTEDKRSKLVWLSDDGHRCRSAAQTGWQAAQDRIAGLMGDGRLAALRFMLDEAHARLEDAE
jgi:DNA-binding MarR family transcriptional regulator